MKNDNRMSWIRMGEKIAREGVSYCYEYEIASEQQITGVLNYQNGQISAGLYSMESDKNGLHHYLLKISYPPVSEYNSNASRKGYYFKDGILGELLSLLAVHFQCRFYLVATMTGELSPLSIRTKFENDFLYRKVSPEIHTSVLKESGKNWITGSVSGFLDLVKNMDIKHHQKFILACHYYHLALKEIGIDSEMVFIRLVSAVEVLAESLVLSSKEDELDETKVKKMIEESELTNKSKMELKKIFNVRGSKKKFVRFVETYSAGFFKGGNYNAKHCKIKKENLASVLGTIYNARSEYLHSCESMYLSIPMRISQKWDTDPSAGMIIDNRSIPVTKKMPYTHFFEGLVRHCLINFLKKNSKIV